MTTFTRFEQLDVQATFEAIVTEHFTNAWDLITGALAATPVVSEDRVSYAYELYQANLKGIRLKVPSQNPDHYKRAACLLDALNQAQVIEDVDYDQGRCDELESGMAFGVSHMDAQYEIKGMKLFEFFGNNGNQGMAFDLAFRCCEVYEPASKPYDPHFFESMIHYLCEDGRNLDGLYLIFKAYWSAPAKG